MSKTPFQQLCEVSGLSPIFGPSALTRALSRVGVDGPKASRDQLRAAMAEIDKAIAVFLQPKDVAAAKERVRALLE